jgi:hypothetical protein
MPNSKSKVKAAGYTLDQQSHIYRSIYRKCLVLKKLINAKNNNKGIQYKLDNTIGESDTYHFSITSVDAGVNSKGLSGWHPKMNILLINKETKQEITGYILFEIHHGCTTTDPVPKVLKLKTILKNKTFKLSINIDSNKFIKIADFGFFGSMDGLTERFINKVIKDKIYKPDPPGKGPPLMVRNRFRS